MSRLRGTAHWIWKIPLAGVAYAVGVVLVGGTIAAVGGKLPALPVAADAEPGVVHVLATGMAMAGALAVLAAGLGGRWWQRWGLLAVFVAVVYGVGNALEGSIFTTLGGQWTLMLINVGAASLCALVVCLPPTPETGGLREAWAAFGSSRSTGSVVWRSGLAVLAFPFFYFLFGMLISPIVVPHYAELDFLTIPPMPVMLQVLFLRSVLFLAVSLPIVVAWRRSRAALVVALGLGHFVAVGGAGLIQATFFPAVLRWTHGLEILADSVFYAWALVWLLLPGAKARRSDLERQERERAERYA